MHNTPLADSSDAVLRSGMLSGDPASPAHSGNCACTRSQGRR